MTTLTTSVPSTRTEALYALAFNKLGEEKFQDAASLLRLMLHLVPRDERAWLGLGLCHERLGQLRMASELYAAGTLAAKPSGRCALACARALLKQGRDDEASDLFEAAIDAFESKDDDEWAAVARNEMEQAS